MRNEATKHHPYTLPPRNIDSTTKALHECALNNKKFINYCMIQYSIYTLNDDNAYQLQSTSSGSNSKYYV